MPMNRRTFLTASAAAGAGLALPSIVRATTPWAELGGGAPKYKILEIHLPGGASQWESLWVSHDAQPGTGADDWLATGPAVDGLNWRGLRDYVQALTWTCNGAPDHSLSTREFAEDEAGTPVSWGPATAPLWRPDIFDRCRMLVTQHGEDLHSAGSFRTVTGRRFGNPRAAAMGTPIQRHFQSLAQQQEVPYAYVLGPEHDIRSYFQIFPTAIGNHSGAARPLGLKVGSGLGDTLLRPGITRSADALFARLGGQYRNMLRHHGGGAPVRAADFEAFDGAGFYLRNARQLDPLLGGDQLDAAPMTPCVSDPSHDFSAVSNPTRRSLELAALLLDGGARHVSVVDGGYLHDELRNGRMPYDAHANRDDRNVVETTSANLFAVFKALADIIQGPGEAGGVPKIDLDDTLVYVSTEFNRTPRPTAEVNDDGYAFAGREHYASATAALLIGGPVEARAIHGSIGLQDSNGTAILESAIAGNPLTPTDVHAGVLMAAGVDPTDPDNFTEADDFSAEVRGNGNPAQIRAGLAQHVLGLD